MKRLWELYGIMKIIDIYLKKKGTQNRPLRHPMLKTLYFRVKSIYWYKLLSVRKVGRKPTIGYISYTMVWKFMKQYIMIYSIKCFLQINKDSTNILLSIAFSIFSIRLMTACLVENFFFEIQIVFCIEPFFGHSKIPLTFYA